MQTCQHVPQYQAFSLCRLLLFLDGGTQTLQNTPSFQQMHFACCVRRMSSAPKEIPIPSPSHIALIPMFVICLCQNAHLATYQYTITMPLHATRKCHIPLHISTSDDVRLTPFNRNIIYMLILTCSEHVQRNAIRGVLMPRKMNVQEISFQITETAVVFYIC